MRTSTLFLVVVLMGCVVLSFFPSPSNGHISRARKVRILKKIGALLLLNRKKYLFAVPFPLPVPVPLLKKTQPIIYKEKVPVPVPVHHEPVPLPEAPVLHEPYPYPDGDMKGYGSEQYNSLAYPNQPYA